MILKKEFKDYIEYLYKYNHNMSVDDTCMDWEWFDIAMNVLDYLDDMSPTDEYEWKFNEHNYFTVTVEYSDCDKYVDFLDNLVDCRYTYKESDSDSVTLMFSLDSLHEAIIG